MPRNAYSHGGLHVIMSDNIHYVKLYHKVLILNLFQLITSCITLTYSQL